VRLWVLAAIALLPGCAARQINAAHEIGYAEGYHQCEWEKNLVIDALDGGNDSLMKSLKQCYARLDKCKPKDN
jgi:hypothetical protein